MTVEAVKPTQAGFGGLLGGHWCEQVDGEV